MNEYIMKTKIILPNLIFLVPVNSERVFLRQEMGSVFICINHLDHTVLLVFPSSPTYVNNILLKTSSIILLSRHCLYLMGSEHFVLGKSC